MANEDVKEELHQKVGGRKCSGRMNYLSEGAASLLGGPAETSPLNIFISHCSITEHIFFSCFPARIQDKSKHLCATVLLAGGGKHNLWEMTSRHSTQVEKK